MSDRTSTPRFRPARIDLEGTMWRRDGRPVEWRLSDGLVPYAVAVAEMEARAVAIAEGVADEQVWLLEHPPLYTAGTSTGTTDLSRAPLPVHRTGRGGQVTYHGPGQRVAYLMLDLRARTPDLRAFVRALERWIIATLGVFGIAGETREDRVGVWVRRPKKAPGIGGTPAEDKIAAIGIRVRRWVAFHGVSLNVRPDLTHYAGITPCGIADAHLGVTSFADLGYPTSIHDVDAALRVKFAEMFGPIF